jgi:tetratricopeptide (TPR) repeat protein
MLGKNFHSILWAGLGATLLTACEPSKQTSDQGVSVAQIVCRTTPTDLAWYSSGKKAPLFDSLGNLHFAISTQNPEAQRYFEQGLMLAMGFNHAEAARSFYEATRLDSTCAMAHWGFAYVLGPNYNAGMEPDNYQRAYAAVQRAVRHSATATEKERALITALAKRYPVQPVENRNSYDEAYSRALKDAYLRYPDDASIGALYVESIMDMHPWDLWDKQGTPRPWTPEIVSILEDLIQRNPDHIAPHHLYIHAVEASKTPQRGLKSAAVLGKLAPGASHLVHMPSHIYIRTGHYHEGSVANQRAVGVDSAYLTSCFAQGAFPLAYFPHNYHFMAATATMEGDTHTALQAARKVAEFTNKKLLAEPGWGTLQHYYTIPYYVAIKFSLWDEVLHMVTADTASIKYPTAIRHYARGMALTGKGQTSKARAELALLEKLASDPDIAALTIWDINTMTSILEIARRVLKAEILAHEGYTDPAIKLLREAVSLEDQLNYNEPPDWFFSVRHNLGTILLEAHRYAEAEAVYKEDLETLPRNVWAMAGLQAARKDRLSRR